MILDFSSEHLSNRLTWSQSPIFRNFNISCMLAVGSIMKVHQVGHNSNQKHIKNRHNHPVLSHFVHCFQDMPILSHTTTTAVQMVAPVPEIMDRSLRI
jgi:hypothetical protein